MKSWFSSLLGSKGISGPAPVSVANAVVEALIASGQRLEDDGHPAEALAKYREALALTPNSARAHLNLGNAQKLLNDASAALASYRRAVELDPENSAAQLNLGNALLGAKLLPQAEQCYRVALRLRPEWAEAWVALGCVLEEGSHVDEAAAAYRRALAIDPGHQGAAFNLTGMLTAVGDTAGVRQVLLECLNHAPGSLPLMQRLADLEWNTGRLGESISILRRLSEKAPATFVAPHSIFLCGLNYMPGVTAKELLLAHQGFGRSLEASIHALAPLPPIKGEGERRLRVAYVSPDLRIHPVASFIAPVLRGHDRKAVEVFCYYIHGEEDDVTRRLRGFADQWRAAAAWDDETLAKTIRADGIDILVDLAGHTAGNRMGVFARKPAPVQFTWLGYPSTTGLSRMDYRLCDAHTDPGGEAEQWQTEIPARLPDSQWCYEPQNEMPAPSELPRLSRGYWTFGSFNNGRKLNESLLNAWAGILNSLPGSRIRIGRLQDKDTEAWVVSSLSKLGIAPERIQVAATLTMDRFLASLSDIDIALDTFPYNGTTTTCDMLQMGLPVLTVAGKCSHSRVGISLLNAVGLPDWIAESDRELSEVALRQLADVEAVARLRAALPQRMRASALMDAPRFIRNLEAQYRLAWRRWCDTDSERKAERF
jgi:predicted O-linked N-acetylglucosamine transferase (SPINDLY family)